MYAANKRRSRRGVITLEFILVLPIIVLITWGTFQFAILFLVQNTLTHATTVAAREAGKHEPVGEVATVVDKILEGTHCIDIADRHGNPVRDSGVRIIQEVGTRHERPIVTSFGDPDLTCRPPEFPRIRHDEVRVTICMDLTRSPLCNYLFHFGVDELTWEDKRLEISAITKKE